MPKLTGYLRGTGIALVCLLVLLPLVACAGPAAPAGPPETTASLVITPMSGPPKTFITIYGAGFVPGEKIEVIVVMDGVPFDLGRKPMVKEANEVGAFVATGSGIPLEAKPGMYTVTAKGDKGSVAVFPLQVVE